MTESEPGLVVWGTFAVAVYGVVQPWLVAAIQKVRTRRDLVIVETLKPEFFFGTPVGPSVGLYGTIFNRSVKSPIKTISLQVTRIANSEQHRFEMRTFRRNSFANANDGSFAAPFMIDADSAYFYNITFHEAAMTREFESIQNAFTAGWLEHVRANPTPNAADANATKLHVSNLFRSLRKTTFPAWYMTAFNSLNRMFFWRAGDWRLTIKVVVLDDPTTYQHSWQITLSENDEARLSANVTTILTAWAGQSTGLQNFASPDYHRAENPGD